LLLWIVHFTQARRTKPGQFLFLQYFGRMKDYQTTRLARRQLSGFWNKFPPNFRGMLLMGISAAIVSISHTLVRGLSAEIHPMQIGLFRTFFHIKKLF
tara:strand:- start:159 stop:452 length:294 start_codon:yes stop_codon:yes gene_type:complete